ncbi:hypothetical protein DBT_2275 [Dissulfuribacter thermophilus]|uniref:DUF1318 domain-containing protein n=2 Tax=Dissulfuribacter thermophilus TaxID=1156395 RepID=A0A1B9F2X5_9BACT|nr:hypothetical protein DBT_2275 [Dissulfuribacter thermophilus]
MFFVGMNYSAFAVDPIKEAKARMLKRIPAILELKQKGIVGENNRGFLELIRQDKRAKKLVDDENRDRRIIYAFISKQQGVSIDVVERLRAKQIRHKARPGEWLQDQTGRWYKKR